MRMLDADPEADAHGADVSTPREALDPAPLSGLQVVECASFVAGPSAGMALAQLGADVIRVDPLGGASDHERWPVAPGGPSLYWNSLNKGKRSVALDLRSPEGQELVVALVTQPGAGRGVLVENTVNRGWLSYAALSSRRPDVIHLRVQGHADGRPAVDYTVNASVGLPDMTGPETVGTPINHVLPAWDLICGQTVALGLLAALRSRDATGKGAHVQIALADVALAGVASLGWVAEAQLSDRDRPRHGNHVFGSFGVDFATKDGRRVMAVALTEGQWRSLRRVTGTQEVFEALEKALGVDLSRESDRYELRETIAGIVRPWFEARDLADVTEQLDQAHVLWGPYRSLRQMLAETDIAGDALPLRYVDQPDVGTVLEACSPLRWDDAYGDVAPAPRLGEDTEAVLAQVLGLSGREISGLVDRRVIAGARG